MSPSQQLHSLMLLTCRKCTNYVSGPCKVTSWTPCVVVAWYSYVMILATHVLLLPLGVSLRLARQADIAGWSPLTTNVTRNKVLWPKKKEYLYFYWYV